MLSAPLAGEEVPLPDAGWKAVGVFRDVCLATRGKGMDAAVAAILAQRGIKEGPNLPGYGTRAAPMRTFEDAAGREYLIRPGKRGRYGCFVVQPTSPADTAGLLSGSVKAALDATEGLTAKSSKEKKQTYFEWSISGSKDDIRMTPNSDVGGILINLEVY